MIKLTIINSLTDVDLNVFLSFNKIRKLNCTSDDIKKAIGKSEIIELSEDKEKICRKKPLVVKENVEECTIYVENIKADADHEWLSHFFSDFGTVVYVSIPKYQHTKENKGFAFIEFEKEKNAQDALNYFESIGCKMPSDTNPDELTSIKTFVADKNTSEKTDSMPAEEQNPKKRKLSESDDKAEKKLKTESVSVSMENEELITTSQTEDTDTKKKKKHKKDKKKNFIRDLGLKILSKYV